MTHDYLTPAADTRSPALWLALMGLVQACSDAPASVDLPPRDQCKIAVIASDYRSSTVSLLTADGSLCAPDVVDSGSRPPGLLTALSGDLTLPSANGAWPGNSSAPETPLLLIDRYPNAVLTAVNAFPLEDTATSAGGVLWQYAVSPGFAGNPQDIAFIAASDPILADSLGSPGLLVARLESRAEDPDGQDATADGPAEGSDLLWLSAGDGFSKAPTATRRLSLRAHADPGLDPMPTRFARAGGLLWIGLTHLSSDFAIAGPGRVLGLATDALGRLGDADNDALAPVTLRLDIAGFQNCGHVASRSEDSPEAGLWVVCSGIFRAPRDSAQQLAGSGLVYLSAADIRTALDAQVATGAAAPTILTPTWAIHAADAHVGGGEASASANQARPFGFALAVVDESNALVVALGDVTTGQSDRLLLIDRTTSPAGVTRIAHSGPFELGAIYVSRSADDPSSRLILVADADPKRPRLRRFTNTTQAPIRPGSSLAPDWFELTPISVSPTGLPPRGLAGLRP